MTKSKTVYLRLTPELKEKVAAYHAALVAAGWPIKQTDAINKLIIAGLAEAERAIRN